MAIKDEIDEVLKAAESAYVDHITIAYYNDQRQRYDCNRLSNDVHQAIANKITRRQIEARAYADIEAKVRAELRTQMQAQGTRVPPMEN